MFEVGFTELLLICALALIVLGPHRLPQLAQHVGRWVGRARAMARQLRDQLDQEVNFAEDPPRWRNTPAPPAHSQGETTEQPFDQHNEQPDDLREPASSSAPDASSTESTPSQQNPHERSGP